MTTYLVTFHWTVPVCVNATATIIADSKEEAEARFLETNSDSDKMAALDVEGLEDFQITEGQCSGNPIVIEDVEALL